MERGEGEGGGGQTKGRRGGGKLASNIMCLCMFCLYVQSSQSPSCHPVYGAASSTDPQAPRHAPLSFFKPSKVVPTNTALRG